MLRISILFLISFYSYIGHSQVERLDPVTIVDSLDHIQPRRLIRYKNETKPYCVLIRNQESFNKINEIISDALDKGHQNIELHLKKGVYFFKDNHLKRVHEKNDASISIVGHNATLIAAGHDYQNGERYMGDFSPSTTFVRIDDESIFDFYDDVAFADSLIQVIDEESKLCRIPYAKIQEVPEDECTQIFVTITEWYRSCIYKVLKIEKGGIFFIADNLENIQRFSREEYNVNYDYIFGEKNPRFKLCNPVKGKNGVRINDGKMIGNMQTIHECSANNFLFLGDVRCKSLFISGVHFIGNRDGAPLMRFNNVNAHSVVISNCQFEGIQSSIVFVDGTDNVLFCGNKISNCYRTAFYSDHACKNIRVEDNSFYRTGLSLDQTFCVRCSGEDFYIANNHCCDFCYDAIAVGAWYGTKLNHRVTGVVEKNVLWYSDEFIENLRKYTLMDSGAIDLWTQIDDAIIRYNYICNYAGMGHNRGIFCDDGASNFKIYGNVILNTPNCYAIDSRRVAEIETANNPQSYSERTNVNNLMMYNVTNGTIRFVGREDELNGCMKGADFILENQNSIQSDSRYVTTYKNLKVMENDVRIDYNGIYQGKAWVSKGAWRMMKEKLPFFRMVKRHIKRKNNY